MSTSRKPVAVFPTETAESFIQDHQESFSSLRNAISPAPIGDAVKETPRAPADQNSVEVSECDRLEEGYLVACVSCDDPSTSFWVGKIAGFEECKNTTTNYKSQNMVRVQWYQASGSARDPFDAAYVPARKPQLIVGNSSNGSIWESVIGHKDIITSFSNLTNESRLSNDTVAKIKKLLYK